MFNLFKKKADIEFCDNEFDIERVDVYAIERIKEGGTLISYYENGECQSFYILTTIEQHNKYVSRFRMKLEIKNADQVS